MKLQNINYENMILICHIYRYIILPLFTSYRKSEIRKSEICFKYLRMLSRMKAAYIFYFQYSFQDICIINMYVIIHGSVQDDLLSKIKRPQNIDNTVCIDHYYNAIICSMQTASKNNIPKRAF